MITVNAMSTLKPVIATPSAVPAAGGCSIFILTIMKIENPTAREYKIILPRNKVCGIKANNSRKQDR